MVERMSFEFLNNVFYCVKCDGKGYTGKDIKKLCSKCEGTGKEKLWINNFQQI
jgi:DnaJ-class molecular chaperone